MDDFTRRAAQDLDAEFGVTTLRAGITPANPDKDAHEAGISMLRKAFTAFRNGAPSCPPVTGVQKVTL